MKEEQAREELRFIYQVMREASRSIRSLHRILIFFGSLLIIGSGGTYLLNQLYPPLGTTRFYWFWLGYWLVPVLLFITYELRRQSWRRPISWGEKLLWVLWGSCIVGAVLLMSVLPYIAVKAREAMGLPLGRYLLIGQDPFLKWAPAAVLFGLALILTGYIYRIGGLTGAGLGCWLTALVLAITPALWVQGVAGAGLGLSFLYAGWKLKREQKRREWLEILQRFKELVYETQLDDA